MTTVEIEAIFRTLTALRDRQNNTAEKVDDLCASTKELHSKVDKLAISVASNDVRWSIVKGVAVAILAGVVSFVVALD